MDAHTRCWVGRRGWPVAAMAAGLLAGAAGGCAAWPGVTSAKGTVNVAFASEGSTQPTQPVQARRMVVVTYWRTPPVNENPASYDFVGAFAVDSADFPVSVAPRMYAVVSTPASGVQHIAPEAGIIVFCEGCWPAYAVGWCGGKARARSGPPVQTGLAFDVTLLPDTKAPLRESSAEAMAMSRFPPLADQLEALRWLLATGRGITDADRLTVYRQLAGHVRMWKVIRQRGEPQTDPKRVNQATAELDRRAAELERAGAGK